MLRVITYLCLLMLSGCAQQQPIISQSLYSLDKNNPQHLSDTTKSLNPETNTNHNNSITPAKYANFSGIVTVTQHQRTIRLCHNEQVFNLQANTILLAQIKRLNQTSAYIEFEGQINQSVDSTHQRPIISVEQLHYLSNQDNSACDISSAAPIFTISGSEPDWMGYAQGNQLTFVIKDLNSQWKIKKSIITKGLRAFVETENSDGEQLNIAFAGNGCIDSNNNYWHYETKLFLNDKQTKGCGKYPNQQETHQDWLGHYSYKNSTVSIQLALLAHNQAKVTYLYANGKQLSETGFWHLYGSSGLKLLLTKHQGNKVNIVFHFRRDGVRMQASQQWRNNQKYNFNGSILTLDRMTDDIDVETVTAVASNNIIRTFQAQNITSPTVSKPAINYAIKNYFEMHRTTTDNSKYWFSEYDLNGNGRKDLLVMLDWCESDGCVLLVFENKPEQYKFVSRITQVQAPIQISKAQHYQWQSLLIKHQQQWQQLDFDGISYPAASIDGTTPAADAFSGVNLISNNLAVNKAIMIE